MGNQIRDRRGRHKVNIEPCHALIHYISLRSGQVGTHSLLHVLFFVVVVLFRFV